MSLLPTAHAGQAYGARRIDFFAVSGEVVAADAGSGRIRDDDGIEHDIRLLERTETLKPGDSASILRVQAGPKRRSRPAAVINHSRQLWARTAPDATTLLARSGVTRGLNWWLAVLALALTALVSIWPLLHAFLTEMNGTMMAGIPDIDVFAEINMLAPSLAGWRLENNLPTGLLDAIASLDLVSMDQLTGWGIAAGGAVLGAAAYFARSWRLIYVPVLAGFALAAGAILGGPEATLALCGGVLMLFLLGGLVNRVRDAGRFNARVERLVEHALRNPPQEGVRASETATRDTSGLAPAAAAASAIATAAAVAQGSEDDGAESDSGEEDAADDTVATDETDEAETADAAAPGEDAANGEVEAGPSLEVPPSQNAGPADPAPGENAALDATGDAEAAPLTDPEPEAAAEAADETVEAGDSETAPAPEIPDTAEAMAALAAAMREGEDGVAVPQDALPADAADEEATQAQPVASDAAEAVAEAEMPAADPEAPVSGAETAAQESDDDLPSLDAVAAAAALNAAEQNAGDSDADAATAQPASAAALEDERTMPLAPPPPMPAATDMDAPADAVDAEAGEPVAQETEAEPEQDAEPQLNAASDEGAESTDAAEAPASPADRLAEVETRVEAAVDAVSRDAAATTSLVDDPLMADGPDPMLPKAQAGDFAPGAPDLEFERDPAE